jgi:hypothetical protein
MTQNLNDAIKKALSTAAGQGGDFLPTPLATEFVQFVREKNFLRQMFKSYTMTSKTRDVPKILGGTKVYYQPTEGGAANKTSMNTGTIRLTAKKFMSQIDVTEEVIEDAAAADDMQSIVKNHFSEQCAAAEEETMIVGDPDHSPVTATEGSANETTWFNKDHRLAFAGLLTLAGDTDGVIADDTRAANRVNAGGSDMLTGLARQAMFNLGKYGRVMQNLVLILNPWSVNQLIDDPKLVTLEKYGPNATIFTGEVGKLYGKITVINSSYATDGYGVMTHVSNPMIGDRRMIKIKQTDWIFEDTKVFVLTERLDFAVSYKGALCQIYNLDLPSYNS